MNNIAIFYLWSWVGLAIGSAVVIVWVFNELCRGNMSEIDELIEGGNLSYDASEPAIPEQYSMAAIHSTTFNGA